MLVLATHFDNLKEGLPAVVRATAGGKDKAEQTEKADKTEKAATVVSSTTPVAN